MAWAGGAGSIRREQDDRGRSRLSRSRSSLSNLISSSSSLGEALLGGSTPARTLSNHHREVFRRLEAQAAEAGEEYSGDTLYSRVHSENYTDPRDTSARMTTSDTETTTPLARSVLSGAFLKQHRDMLGESPRLTQCPAARSIH